MINDDEQENEDMADGDIAAKKQHFLLIVAFHVSSP